MLMRLNQLGDLGRVAQLFARAPVPLPQAFMPLDAWREGDNLVIRVDVPGVDPSSVDVTVDRNTLTIHAERTWMPPEDVEVIVSERPFGSFTREVDLGDVLDTEHVQASYDNGVLTLTIPIAEEEKPRKLPIAVGEDGSAPPAPEEVLATEPTTDPVGDLLID